MNYSRRHYDLLLIGRLGLCDVTLLDRIWKLGYVVLTLSFPKDEEDYQRYRYYVIYRLPKLKFLDSNLVTAKERQEAQRVGQFMRVVQPSADLLSKQDELARKRSQEDDPDYSPLPDTLAREGGHKGTYGVCRYVYYGRHSEGNRFIRNSDL